MFSKILENKIRKFEFKLLEQINNNNKDDLKQKNENNKFSFIQSNYCQINNIYNNNNNFSQIYEEYNTNDYKIKDIKFRIGYPYLFRHIEYCDHMIILNDIRLEDKFDKYFKNDKILVSYQKKLKRRICDACEFYYAKFISINDPIAVNSPLNSNNNKCIFICDYCLKKLHEKERKENTMSTLKLIPYFHD